MTWSILIVAGLFEVVGVMGIARIAKVPSLSSYVLLFGGFTLSFLLLSIAMKTIPMGTAYAVWTAIGTVGSALVGMILYGESRSFKKIFFIALIIFSVVGLKLID